MNRSTYAIHWRVLALLAFLSALAPWEIVRRATNILVLDYGVPLKSTQGGADLARLAWLVLAVGACWLADRTSRFAALAICLTGTAVAVASLALLRSDQVASAALLLSLLQALAAASVALGYAALADIWGRSSALGIGVAKAATILAPPLVALALQALNLRDILSSLATLGLAVTVLLVAAPRLLGRLVEEARPHSDFSAAEVRRLLWALGLIGGVSATAIELGFWSYWARFGADPTFRLALMGGGAVGVVASAVAIHRFEARAVARWCGFAAIGAGLLVAAGLAPLPSAFIKITFALSCAVATFAWTALFVMVQQTAPHIHRATRAAMALAITGIIGALATAIAALEIYGLAETTARSATSAMNGSLALHVSSSGSSTMVKLGLALPSNLEVQLSSLFEFGRLLALSAGTTALLFLTPAYLLVGAPGALPGLSAHLQRMLSGLAGRISAPRPLGSMSHQGATTGARRFCGACGRPATSQATFCGGCGSRLQDPSG